MGTIHTNLIVKELQRELGVRRRVYPKWINSGMMKQADASFRIAVLEQLLAEQQAKIPDSPYPHQPTLFENNSNGHYKGI